MATVEVTNAVAKLHETVRGMVADGVTGISINGKGIKLPKKQEKPKQGKLFPLSDSERQEKVEKLLSTLDELEHLKAERKEFMSANKDQQEDAEKRIRVLREDLGLPETSLGPNALAARDEERARED